MGLVFGISGWARRMAVFTRASPISVAAEVQPYPMTSNPNPVGKSLAAVGIRSSMARSVSAVTRSSMGIRVANAATPTGHSDESSASTV